MKPDKYLYIKDCVVQVNKRENFTCGDYSMMVRTPEYTDFILCDGMGSGPKANMSAIMCANRILTLMQNGISIYKACEKAVKLMHRARIEDIPFAAFSVARINRLGHYTALSYEIPAPVIVKNNIAQVAVQRHFTSGHEVVSEAVGKLEKGDSLILTSDGVSQAGLGILSGMGWGIEGFVKFVNNNLNKGYALEEIIKKTLDQTYRLSGRVYADDTSIALLSGECAKILNILTGPPAEKALDKKFINAFHNQTGLKVICGSTTADIAARELGLEVHTDRISTDFNQPPRYKIDGIDLVSEGAVTLNQVYNILDVDIDRMMLSSVVCDIAKLMISSNIINIYLGDAYNSAHADISFKQIGIAEREKIIELLVEKLSSKGKVIKIYKPNMV